MTTSKTQIKKGDTITVRGNRWFQTTYGNTYFSAIVYLNDDEAARIPFEYGYGDHYLDRIMGEFWKTHTPPKGFNIDRYFSRELRDYGVEFTYSVKDGLKRELNRY